MRFEPLGALAIVTLAACSSTSSKSNPGTGGAAGTGAAAGSGATGGTAGSAGAGGVSGGAGSGAAAGTGGTSGVGGGPPLTRLFFDDFERPDNYMIGSAKTPVMVWQKTNGGAVKNFNILISLGRLAFRVRTDTTSIGIMNTRLTMTNPIVLLNVRLRAKVERSSCDGHVRVLLNSNVTNVGDGFGFHWAKCPTDTLTVWEGTAPTSNSIPLPGIDTAYYVELVVDKTGQPSLSVATDQYPSAGGTLIGGPTPGMKPSATPGSTVHIDAGGESAKTAGQAYIHEVEVVQLP